MAVKGVFASDQNIQAVRKGDFASGLLQYNPTGSAPLLALSAGMESADASDTVVTWFEENRITGRVGITNNAGTGTSLTVDDASTIVPGQVYIIEASGEHIYVDAVSGNTVTVTRGFAGSSIQAIDGSVTTAYMQKLGTAHEEGSAKPESVANVGFPVFNYMEIFRNSWDATRTAKRVDYLTGNVVAKNRRDAANMHAEDIERAIWWHRKTIGVRNGKPFRTMDGIVRQIEQRQINPAALASESTSTKWTDIDAFLQAVFSVNIKGKPNERIAFCDNQVVSVINGIARLDGTMNLQPGETEFGLKVMRWLTPYGDISLMTHPLMNEMEAFRGNLYVIHPGAIRTRYLERTFEDSYDKDGTRAGADADFGVYTTEMTIEYRGARTGGIYTGMSTPAAS